jgi:hypothetical protein
MQKGRRRTLRTSNPKEGLWLAQPACKFITTLKHLNHPIHLPSGVRDIIMLDVEFVLLVRSILSIRCRLSLVLLSYRINSFSSGCSVFGGVSVRMRSSFFVFVVCETTVDVDYDVGCAKVVGCLALTVVVRIWERQMLLAIEGAGSFGGAEAVVDFSDAAFGAGIVTEICTVAGGAFMSASADMAAGKLGRWF